MRLTSWISPGQFPYTGTSRPTPSRLSDYSLVKEQSKLSFANSDGNFRYDRRGFPRQCQSRLGRRNNIVRFRSVNWCREFYFQAFAATQSTISNLGKASIGQNRETTPLSLTAPEHYDNRAAKVRLRSVNQNCRVCDYGRSSLHLVLQLKHRNRRQPLD